MVKAKTKALNLLLPGPLSDWFSDYAKSENKTKTEIICSLLQGLQNGEAYSDVANPVDNSVDGIELIVKAYLDKHLQSYIDSILHNSKQSDVVNPIDDYVESVVDDSVVNPVESSVDSYVESSVVNPVDDSVEPEPQPIIDAIAATSAKTKTTKKQSKKTDTDKPYTLVQINRAKGLEKMKELGLEEIPESGKDFAILHPDHFEYDDKNKKLSYKKPKSHTP